MSETINHSDGDGQSKKSSDSDRPVLEEAAEIGAQVIAKRTGKPVAVVLDEAERKQNKRKDQDL